MLSRYDSALSGLFGRIVIMEQLLQFFTAACGTRTRFKDDAKIKQASESYLESMQQKFYLTSTKELFDKCNICIAVKGDYIE